MQIILDTLTPLNLRYPETTAERRNELFEIRKQLVREDDMSSGRPGRND